MSNRTYVIGVGMTKFDKPGVRDWDYPEMALASGTRALADAGTLIRAADKGLSPADYLQRHDAYPFFEGTGDLFKTGLTQTNVMDVRVILVR